jgi:hypothetical protein
MGAVAAIAPAVASLAGGVFQGLSSAGQNKQQLAITRQQLRDQESQEALGAASQSQLGGLRDQVVYQLMNNLGQSPSAFNPVNYGAPTNTGIQGTGGYNLNQEAQHAAGYTPGAGGTNTNVLQAVLGQLGYSNASDIQTKNNPGSQSYSYGGNVYQNGTGPLGTQTAGLQPGYTLQSHQGAGDWNAADPSGGSFTGKTYTPPGQAPAFASSAQRVAPPAQHAGYSMGGGVMTPAGPGTSGWGGGTPQQLQAAYQAGMGNLTNG